MHQLELFKEFEGVSAPAHSKIGASSMYRWSKCPGSVRLSQGIESVSSKYAEEGTRAHEIASEWLLLGSPPDRIIGEDSEGMEAVQTYVEFVQETAKGAELFVERRFDLSKLHPGLFGTADAVVYQRRTKRLLVIDYKHGSGVAVEVTKNPQLLYYGLGAMLSFPNFQVETVELVIVQPRCDHSEGPIRRWEIPSWDLLEFSADLIDFAKATEKPDAPIVPGNHCRFCPAAGICPGMHEKAITLAKEEFRSDLSYDPKKLAEVLSWVPALKEWCNAVTEFAYREASSGRIPPGFKLVDKRATRKWIGDEAASEFLRGKLKMSPDDIYERSLRSPAQIEKLLPKADKAKIAEVVVAVSSGTTLVPETSKRPAARSRAELDFADSPLE